jgi:S1-C subfamily serine protease
MAGFVAGLAVTAGTRASVSNTTIATPEMPATPAPTAAAVGAPALLRPCPRGPDFTTIAGQAARRRQYFLGAVVGRQFAVHRRSLLLPFGNQDDLFGSRDRRSLSLGSGVMISRDGYVVTNNHVVGENVSEITIALPDKREIRGKVIGTDPATDIALLKIGVTAVPAVTWGDSSQLKVGEWVLAIGSPFQLSQTVTAGIVSATGRANVGFAAYEDFIQTDAAINPGNSGARSSTAAANWSASTRASSARAADTRASASPSPATSCVTSSTT